MSPPAKMPGMAGHHGVVDFDLARRVDDDAGNVLQEFALRLLAQGENQHVGADRFEVSGGLRLALGVKLHDLDLNLAVDRLP